jgi:hypothetical protein
VRVPRPRGFVGRGREAGAVPAHQRGGGPTEEHHGAADRDAEESGCHDATVGGHGDSGRRRLVVSEGEGIAFSMYTDGCSDNGAIFNRENRRTGRWIAMSYHPAALYSLVSWFFNLSSTGRYYPPGSKELPSRLLFIASLQLVITIAPQPTNL